MASVVLGAIGSAVGGSAGRTLGTLIGNAIDGTTHKGSIRDLNLQSSAYGDTIPLIFGRVRTGGVLIWALPLQERSLGAKGTTTRHAYSASFAIALAARPIAGIGRVWADGKLMGSAGAMPRGTTMRVYTGDERQTPDPLIAAAESPGQVPAHRGIAYVVFEDLDLSPYANRMPALSFEVIADAVIARRRAGRGGLGGRVGHRARSGARDGGGRGTARKRDGGDLVVRRGAGRGRNTGTDRRRSGVCARCNPGRGHPRRCWQRLARKHRRDRARRNRFGVLGPGP